MNLSNFAKILLITLALSGYSAWSMSVRSRTPVGNELSAEALPSKIPLVRTDEAAELWRQDGTLFLDVRSATDYYFGHIAGAVNLPDEDFEKGFADLKPRLERATVIVVYCKSVDCGKSLWSAIRLRNEGLSQARIYPEGWNEWVNRGLPSVKSSQ